MSSLERTNIINELKSIKEDISTKLFAVGGISLLDGVLVYGLVNANEILYKVGWAMFILLMSGVDIKEIKELINDVQRQGVLNKKLVLDK